MNIVVVAFEHAQVLDVTGPMEVFAEANVFSDFTPYRVHCVGMSKAPVTMSNGLALDVPPYQEFDEPIDTLLIPGGEEVLALDQASVAWIREKSARARRVASVCTGAFLLAKMGLLDGRRVTTHWEGCDRLQKLAPKAVVDPDAIFTRDGNLYTSAGVTAGIDLTLHLVEEDVGRAVALRIARNLVLYLRRPGGQSQFSAPLSAQVSSGIRFGPLVDYVTTNPDADLGVDALAAKASMSARHFSRAFKSEMGTTPAKFVAHVRLDAVCNYLTQTKLPIKRIVSKAGYRSVDVLTRAFRDQFGITPDAYRQRFGSPMSSSGRSRRFGV